MAYLGPNTSRTQDGAGNNITSIGDNAGQLGLAVATVATDFALSTVNSTTTQLAPNASFVGTIETIYFQQNISMLLTSDQPGMLTLNQYIDAAGLQKASSLSYNIQANVGFSRAFVANGNYFNLTFINTGPATTTNLSINTAYGTIPNVTNLGNAPIAINEVNGTAIVAGQSKAASSVPVVIASDQPAVSTTDTTLAAAQTTDGSISTFISGDPNGDFAGVNILEQVVTDGTGLFLNTRLQNPVKTDLNNATVLSDAPPSTILVLAPNQPQIIDTTGYQTVVFQQTVAAAVTVTHSNDGATYSSVLGLPLSATAGTYSGTTAATANLISAFPVAARYMRFSSATLTNVIIYLRQQPFASFAGYGNQTVTASVSGTAAVGATTAANPVLVGGVDSGALVRRVLTDTAGQLQTDVNNQLYNGAIYTEQFLPLRVEQIHTNRGQDSLQDLLTQILVELKTLNYYTRETPNSINLMLQQSSLAGFMPASMQDEQEQFFSDSTLFNLIKGQ
jgi:hypothetical protein